MRPLSPSPHACYCNYTLLLLPLTARRGRSRQKKFTDLAGSTEAQGDLKSVVLHKMSCSAQKSTFPFALGVKISAVDAETFSSTGDAYSMITMPNSSSTTAITLQEDDTAL